MRLESYGYFAEIWQNCRTRRGVPSVDGSPEVPESGKAANMKLKLLTDLKFHLLITSLLALAGVFLLPLLRKMLGNRLGWW